MSTIEGLMQEQLVTAAPTETVDAVVKRMCEAGVGAVLVVENDALRGVFSERDLLTRVVGQGRDPATTSVGSVSSDDVVSVGRDASLRECASTLQVHGVRHLPVTNDGKPVGVISARDFFEKVTGELETLIDRLRYDDALKGVEDPYDHVGGSYGR
ncbi:MAG: CBS domain-containing protein [bacterium]|nr:CBS domain-containing protein [bacterium]